MNNIFISNARITNDLETRYSNSGTAIINFSVADNHRNGDKEEVIFWRCAVYGKQAEFLAKYGMKGGRVNVIGEVQPNNYTNKDGQQVSAVQVRVNNIEIVDWKPAENQAQAQGMTQMPPMGQPQAPQGMPQMGQPMTQQPQAQGMTQMPPMGQPQAPQGMPQMGQQPMGMPPMGQPQMQQPTQGMPNLGANNGFMNIPDNLPFN